MNLDESPADPGGAEWEVMDGKRNATENIATEALVVVRFIFTVGEVFILTSLRMRRNAGSCLSYFNSSIALLHPLILPPATTSNRRKNF